MADYSFRNVVRAWVAHWTSGLAKIIEKKVTTPINQTDHPHGANLSTSLPDNRQKPSVFSAYAGIHIPSDRRHSRSIPAAAGTARKTARKIAQPHMLALLPALLATLLAASPAQAQHPQSAVTASTSLQGIAPADLNAYPDVRAHIEQDQLAGALTALQQKQARHKDDPAYFNLLGILALKVGEYATAVTAFERVVLMQPENAGAWLDLAIASAETGNVTGATGYFDYIEEQFNPPPPLRVVISRYRARMAGRADVAPWQVDVDAMVGVDTNANSGLQNSAIPLTFGADRIDLILDPSFHARSDKFVQAGASARYRKRLGNNVAELGMGVRSREYVHENDFSTLSANLSAGLHRATVVGDASTWLHLEHLWLGGSQLLQNIRAIAQLERPIDSCRLGVSAEAEWRRYAALGSLDANIWWGQAGVACDWKIRQLPIQTILIGRTGFDDPTGDRAGGKTRHKEVIAQLGMPLAWGARADLSMTFAEARDAQGYSPLLEQNAPRHLDRRNLRLAVTVVLTPASDLQILAEDNRFQSNLALFQQHGKSLGIGIRHRF